VDFEREGIMGMVHCYNRGGMRLLLLFSCLTFCSLVTASDLPVRMATYLGEGNAQIVPSSVEVTPSGMVVVAGNAVGGGFDFGVKPRLLMEGSATGNSTLLFIRDGKVVGVSKLAGSIAQAKIGPKGDALYAIGSFGLASLDEAGTKLNWLESFSDLPFPVCATAWQGYQKTDGCKVAAGADGSAAVFVGGIGKFHWRYFVLNATGSVVHNATYGKDHFNALAIDSEQGLVMTGGFFEDHLPSLQERGLPVQVCSVFANGYRPGSSKGWTMYDYSGKELSSNQADTRISSLAVLDDGQLWFAGRATGGNSIFRWQNKDLSKPAPNVATDNYNTPVNLGGPTISYLAAVDARSGQVQHGTFALTRLGDSPSAKGNTFETVEIGADKSRVLVAGNAGFAIAAANSSTVNKQKTGPEGASLLVLSRDLSAREHWATFTKAAGKASSSAVGIAARAGVVAMVARAAGDMVLASPLPNTSGPPVEGEGDDTAAAAGGGYLVLL